MLASLRRPLAQAASFQALLASEASVKQGGATPLASVSTAQQRWWSACPAPLPAEQAWQDTEQLLDRRISHAQAGSSQSQQAVAQQTGLPASAVDATQLRGTHILHPRQPALARPEENQRARTVQNQSFRAAQTSPARSDSSGKQRWQEMQQALKLQGNSVEQPGHHSLIRERKNLELPTSEEVQAALKSSPGMALSCAELISSRVFLCALRPMSLSACRASMENCADFPPGDPKLCGSCSRGLCIWSGC